MRRFISMWSLEFCDQNSKYIKKENEVGQNAKKTGNHVDPFYPVDRFSWQCPTLFVVHKDPGDGVAQAGNNGEN